MQPAQTVVHLTYNGSGVVIHVYHSNQTFMVTSQHHVGFHACFLLNCAEDEIRQYNCEVSRALGPGPRPPPRGARRWGKSPF